MGIHEYLCIHGTRGLSILVKEFIQRAPEFKGDKELAAEIGKVIADLESALVQVK